MTNVGQIEKQTQARVVTLFRECLGYDYLGNRSGRDNRKLDLNLLRAWLVGRGVEEALITGRCMSGTRRPPTPDVSLAIHIRQNRLPQPKPEKQPASAPGPSQPSRPSNSTGGRHRFPTRRVDKR